MPISIAEAVSFVALAVALALVPGANLAVVLRNAGRGGQAAAVATTIGLTASKVLWAAASLIGLASALNASAQAYSILKALGGLYLIWLGVSTLRNRGAEPVAIEDTASPTTAGLGWALRDGALSDVLNPKVGAFYLAVFPQYIDQDDNVVLAATVLLALHAAVLMTYYPVVAALTLRLRSLGRKKNGKRIDTIVGAGLIATGALLLTAGRAE